MVHSAFLIMDDYFSKNCAVYFLIRINSRSGHSSSWVLFNGLLYSHSSSLCGNRPPTAMNFINCKIVGKIFFDCLTIFLEAPPSLRRNEISESTPATFHVGYYMNQHWLHCSIAVLGYRTFGPIGLILMK